MHPSIRPKEWTEMSERILANAIVDLIEDCPVPLWEVRVFGGVPGDEHVRIYAISAKTDDNAAQEGIRRFVEEMENLRDAPLEGS